MDSINRFMSHVDCSGGPNACHSWTGNTYKAGYGRFWLSGESHLAHRWILGETLGRPLRWDDDLREMACHTCDNPPCCNPRHLYVGDAKTNVRDAIERERHAAVGEGAKTACVNGHEFTTDNIYIHTKNGSRQCRECRKLRQRKPRGIRMADRTHCPQGHPYDEENTRVRKNGSRDCRACHRERARSKRHAQRVDRQL
jgi:hypothetical protein